MKQNLRDAVVQVVDFLGYRFDSDSIESIVKHSSFEYMRDNPATNFSKGSLFARKDGCVPFIRKGVVGDWKSMFTPSQTQRLDEKYERRMKTTDLNFDFMLNESQLRLLAGTNNFYCQTDYPDTCTVVP